MKFHKRLSEAFEAGRGERGSHFIGGVYGRATLNVVGTEMHSELRKGFNEITKQRAKKKPHGLLEKAAYKVGFAYDYLVNP